MIKSKAETMKYKNSVQPVARAQSGKQKKKMIKSKADTNWAWQQSKELAKQQNSTQRLNDLHNRSDWSNAPLRLR